MLITSKTLDEKRIIEMCIRDRPNRKEGAAEGGTDDWGEVVTR